MKPFIRIVCFVMLPRLTCFGIILYNADNQATTSHPGLTLGGDFSSAPWLSVGQVVQSDGSGISGSAVHLGDGWMITADHVSVNGRGVLFSDGVGFHERDTSFTPQQIGNADLKIFRLLSTPSVPGVPLQTEAYSTITSLHVGWGRGRGDTPLGESTVTWGNNSTIDHRWGLNTPVGTSTLNYSGYSQTSIYTILGNDQGDYEAALTTFDSGSGFFQFHDGQWKLTGVAITVETIGSSFFGTENENDVSPPRGHLNYMVYIPELQADIIAVIPEPGSLVLGLIVLGAWGLILRTPRRRNLH
jgi:hypothetical protein